MVNLYLGLYCSATTTFKGTEYTLSNLKIKKADVKSLVYRDEGCLGNMVVELKNKTVKRTPYLEYNSLLRSFFYSL